MKHPKHCETSLEITAKCNLYLQIHIEATLWREQFKPSIITSYQSCPALTQAFQLNYGTAYFHKLYSHSICCVRQMPIQTYRRTSMYMEPSTTMRRHSAQWGAQSKFLTAPIGDKVGKNVHLTDSIYAPCSTITAAIVSMSKAQTTRESPTQSTSNIVTSRNQLSHKLIWQSKQSKT
jgi:hypothetical protein